MAQITIPTTETHPAAVTAGGEPMVEVSPGVWATSVGMETIRRDLSACGLMILMEPFHDDRGLYYWVGSIVREKSTRRQRRGFWAMDAILSDNGQTPLDLIRNLYCQWIGHYHQTGNGTQERRVCASRPLKRHKWNRKHRTVRRKGQKVNPIGGGD